MAPCSGGGQSGAHPRRALTAPRCGVCARRVPRPRLWCAAGVRLVHLASPHARDPRAGADSGRALTSAALPASLVVPRGSARCCARWSNFAQPNGAGLRFTETTASGAPERAIIKMVCRNPQRAPRSPAALRARARACRAAGRGPELRARGGRAGARAWHHGGARPSAWTCIKPRYQRKSSCSSPSQGMFRT